MEFITSERGGRKLAVDGYLYYFKKELADGILNWECVLRRGAHQCKAYIRTTEDRIVGRTNEHTHPPDPAKNEAEKARSAMKKRALDTEDRTRSVVARGIANISPQACAQLPSTDTMSRDVRLQRQANDPPVPAPDNKLFDIPDQFRSTNDGKVFLRYDNGRDDRILLFATETSMEFLSTCDDWFMDGTFKSSPPQFAQIYTVHGLRGGRNIPTAYAFLPNKREGTYVELLRQMQQLTLVAPRSVLTDFEIGALNAIKTVYPAANLQGCLFHLCQSVHRRVQSEGLQEEYINNNEFRAQVRLLAPLAFVPVAEVEDAFVQVSRRWGIQGRAVIDYFERVYIGQVRAGVRQPPLFDLSMWNVTDRMENDLPRTNNSIEGWHNAFNQAVGFQHPSIWALIKAIRREETMAGLAIAHIEAGQPAPPQKRQYRRVDEHLKAIFLDYRNRNLFDYLRGISYNLL